MQHLEEGAWRDQPAYLVGGGPSLRTFPWAHLRGVPNVVVLNMALLVVPDAAIFFTEDIRVIEEKFSPSKPFHLEWERFTGLKVYHALGEGFAAKALALAPDLHVVERKRRDKFWAKSFSEGLSYSSNSAIGALNILDLLGADPIYLLGVDCRRDGGKANYHGHYPEDWVMPKSQEASFKSDFENWAALHLRHRKVVNLVNPDFLSSVECWPRVDWKAHFDG